MLLMHLNSYYFESATAGHNGERRHVFYNCNSKQKWMYDVRNMDILYAATLVLIHDILEQIFETT